MKTLSLCMIVKNGEKYIDEVISTIKPILNEIIIVDTGSTDNTIDIARKYNAKIYNYEWNNDFGSARNVSLENATSDYVLVLDSDEVLYQEDVLQLKTIIDTTEADALSIKFHNITNENNEDLYNTHIGLRIFKNKCFHYEGKIHEQPIFNDINRKPIILSSGVKVKHYGYLPSNAGEKKRNRNMPIILELLKEDPTNAFHLFNLGNEYLNVGDYDKALEIYKNANNYKDISLAYTPHLLYRLATCLYKMKNENEALSIIEDGLRLYPKCTDMEFLRGTILRKLKRYTLAIDSYNRCIKMGEAPASLSFFSDTHDFKPYVELAQIYYFMDDFYKSYECYIKALNIKPKKLDILYNLGKILNKIYSDKTIVSKNISNLFKDPLYVPNLVLIIDVLLEEGLYEEANISFSNINFDESNTSDVYFLKGRILFYNKEYEEAYEMFNTSISSEVNKGILPDYKKRSYEYMVACSILNENVKKKIIHVIDSVDNEINKQAYKGMLNIYSDTIDKEGISTILQVLNHLLENSEFEAFESSLNILNQVDSNEVLLNLANLYFINNYHDMAVKTILQSIKELDALNTNAVYILNKEFLGL